MSSSIFSPAATSIKSSLEKNKIHKYNISETLYVITSFQQKTKSYPSNKFNNDVYQLGNNIRGYIKPTQTTVLTLSKLYFQLLY